MQHASAELVGPYVLLAEIAKGELSTVYLAKKHGALGFQRLYALKRLKPALSQSLDHVELMLDEARLVSGIQHANVASVLDVGADAGSFVVMEYIEGENLDTLLARAGRAGDQRDPRFIVPPIVDVLNALHALHTATDEAGQPCAIVHEAPRARHMLLGVDGAARLIDFSQVRGRGVRPSRARSERLKVAYMAPEQALSPEQVDLRADLFIVGVTLWEALTGERLFAADTDEQTFQNLLHRRIPRPSEVGVRPPSCFDGICMRALDRDPKNRYGSALEMARELRDEAINQALYAPPAELGAWVRRLAGKELRERRKIAGGDSPSSGGILLDTPVTGALLGPTEAGAAVDDNPYATGRIYGGSYARVSLDDVGDNDKTPAFGTRRGLVGPDDDEPTGHRNRAPEDLGRTQAPLDQRVRAGTLPMLRAAVLGSRVATLSSVPAALDGTAPLAELASAPKPPSAAHAPEGAPRLSAHAPEGAPRPVPKAPTATMSGLYGAASHMQPVARPGVDPDQTQPTLFVPARPGARRDSSAPSPGAYSQVEGSRRHRPSSSSSPAEPRESARLDFDEENTARRPSLVPAAAVESAPVSAAPLASPPPLRARPPARALTEPEFKAPAERPARARTSQPTVPLFAQPITETPPTYVQRRDSSPVKRTIPEGPVGVPHRPFSPEQMPSLAEGITPSEPRAQELEFQGSARRSPSWSPAEPLRAEPAFDRADPFSSLTADSLSPATRDSEPRSDGRLGPLPRGFGLWLGSATLAAIIMLGAGVGLRQWVATRQLPAHVSETNAAGAPRPPAAVEPTPAVAEVLPNEATDPAAERADAGVAQAAMPDLRATPAAARVDKLPARKTPTGAAARPLAKPAVSASALGANSSLARGGARFDAPKKPGGAKTKAPSDLPANPY